MKQSNSNKTSSYCSLKSILGTTNLEIFAIVFHNIISTTEFYVRMYFLRFVPVLSSRDDRYIVDFEKFNDVTVEPLLAKYQASSKKRFVSKFNKKVLSAEGFGILLEESENEDICDDVFTSSNNNNVCEKKCTGGSLSLRIKI